MADETVKKTSYLTVDGLKRLQDELNDLKVNKMREIAVKIGEAREQGDLSENAEYDAAKDEQRDIQARIEQIEAILKHVEVIDEEEADTQFVNIGCRVRVYDIDYEEELEFKIVGSTEANSLGGKISNESPFGMAMIGKKVGEEFAVDMPDGTDHYKILEISRNN